MSLLIFTLRRNQIVQQKAAINLKLMEMRQKLMDYESYATSIADGSVSLNDLMSCPPSLFDRMTKYMFYSHAAAMQGAAQKFGFMSQMYAPQLQSQPPMVQQQYMFMLQKSLYEQERQRFSQIETKILNKENTKAQQEAERLQTQLKLLEAEEQSIREAEDKVLKNSAPKYTA